MSALRASCECCGGPALPGRLCERCVDELSAEAPPVARCPACGRESWDPASVGMTCYRPRPGPELTCSGVLRSTEE